MWPDDSAPTSPGLETADQTQSSLLPSQSVQNNSSGGPTQCGQSRHDGDDLSPGTSHPLLLIMERLHSHSQLEDNVSLLDSKEVCKVN